VYILIQLVGATLAMLFLRAVIDVSGTDELGDLLAAAGIGQ
jgi:hypothetical protein